MPYIKRTKYVVSEDDEIKEEFINCLIEKGEVTPAKARELAYYSPAMSLIRWGKYLTPQEAREFLVQFDNEENTEEINKNVEEDLGI